MSDDEAAGSDYEYFSELVGKEEIDEEEEDHAEQGGAEKPKAPLRRTKIVIPTTPDASDDENAEDPEAKELDDAEEAEEIEEAEDAHDDGSAERDIVDLAKLSKFNQEIIIVSPHLRVTSHKMSGYEQAENVTIRATQIALFNNCFVPTDLMTDPIDMAKKELMMRMSPLRIRRYIGERKDSSGKLAPHYEDWSPNEMQFAFVYADVL